MSSTKSPPSKLLLPWKTRISIFFITAIADAAHRPDGTVNRRLLNFFDRKTNTNPKPVNGVSSSDVTVDPGRNLWFRIFTPTAVTTLTSLPVIVFFHGGGFTVLSPASFPYDAFCRRFARTLPAVVISVNYRLSPEHRYPSQYNDSFDVPDFLDQNGAVLPDNADLSKCILMGDSAGANLAHHVAVRVCRVGLRRIGLISIQPFFGGEERTEAEIRLTGRVPFLSVERTDWLWKVMLPIEANRDHEAVNVSGQNAVDIFGLGNIRRTTLRELFLLLGNYIILFLQILFILLCSKLFSK